MSNRLINISAFLLLLTMFLTALSTIPEESLTFDETAHIGAGYSYLTQRDYRLNPEHPPLVKDAAALPLLFLDLEFPEEDPAWVQEEPVQWWFQFDFANNLIYHSGNNPEEIIFWSKLPMLFIMVFLGWFLFWFAKKRFGPKVAIFALLFFSFSPNFIAHGKLVTTDVAAALGVVLATYFWLNFLKRPCKKTVIFAGLTLGISLLLKFSLVLLLPFFAVITFVYALLKKENVLKYATFAVLAGLVALLFVIYPVYWLHTSNYPIEKQIADTAASLESSPITQLRDLNVFMAKTPVLRPLGEYLLGLSMATQRTAFGNTVYFLGMITAGGWWYYFPVIYFLKNSLLFHILTLISLFSALSLVKRSLVDLGKRIKQWIISQFTVFSMLVFLAIYWLVSVSGNLNIGVRHILPVFPFTYILVSLAIVSGFERIKKPVLKKAGALLIGILMACYALNSIQTYPHYLSYFNEFAGGTEQGYKYAVDSNYDWGQDLKRLSEWVEENNIEKIKLDYFGGGDTEYYLGEKTEPLNPFSGPQKGWIAVSITQLQGGRAKPVGNFTGPAGYYTWLDNYEPVARAGKSIFIYHIY